MKIRFFEKDGVFNENAIGSGVYKFVIKKSEQCRTLYIGESYSMAIRCANHLYELEKDKTYFGLTEDIWNDDAVEIIVDICNAIDTKNCSISERDILLREAELEAIKKEKPLAQIESSDRLDLNRKEKVNKFFEDLKQSM